MHRKDMVALGPGPGLTGAVFLSAVLPTLCQLSLREQFVLPKLPKTDGLCHLPRGLGKVIPSPVRGAGDTFLS